MTTEVAILNREAIALAADSAVTVGMRDGTKIYNSANKLFALSKSCPVGIMIYGNAQLTGVPWETLIKVYRKALGNSSFPKLTDYCENFISFLTKNINFFLESDQISSVKSIVWEIFEDVREEISDSVAKAIEEREKLSKSENKKITKDIIKKFCKNIENIETIEDFSEEFVDTISQKYKKVFEDLVRIVFDELSLTKQDVQNLLQIAVKSITKNTFSSSASGIVIAGFGEEEVFPSLHTYNIECAIEGKLKYSKNKEKSHEIGSYPVIIPFAQEDMISTFVEGIDPRLQKLSLNVLNHVLANYFETIIEKARDIFSTEPPDTVEEKVNQMKEDFNDIKTSLLDQYNENMLKCRHEIHIDPILTTVSILPKDELGAMAEALVNLTSLKRRVTTDAETVGGPTDVALISKGDGFVWIKRKHYFESRLNPDFFANKFGVELTEYKRGDNDQQ